MRIALKACHNVQLTFVFLNNGLKGLSFLETLACERRVGSLTGVMYSSYVGKSRRKFYFDVKLNVKCNFEKMRNTIVIESRYNSIAQHRRFRIDIYRRI